MQSCDIFLSVFHPFNFLPHLYMSADGNSSFLNQDVLHNLFERFLFWRWTWILILDVEEAVVPSLLYIWLDRRESTTLYTEQQKMPYVQNGLLHVNISHSTNHFWHFVTLNSCFSEISVLVLSTIVRSDCRTIFLFLAFLWIRKLASPLYSWPKADCGIICPT